MDVLSSDQLGQQLLFHGRVSSEGTEGQAKAERKIRNRQMVNFFKYLLEEKTLEKAITFDIEGFITVYKGFLLASPRIHTLSGIHFFLWNWQSPHLCSAISW